MTSTFTEQYTGLYATPELVGRRQLLDKFERVLRDTSSDSRLVFLFGIGGIGKTRLLKKILEIARSISNCRVAEDILDFYHIVLHTPIGLTDALFEVLTPPFDCFQSYQPAYQALNRARLSGNVVELEKLRQDATDKFDQDLKSLSLTSRIVIVLDTVERVVYGLPGWADEIPLAEGWNWLMEHLPDWQNVVIFVAGREEARPAIEQIKVQKSVLVEEIEVGPFNLDESLEYFEKVAQLADDKKDYHLANRLKNLHVDFKRGAYAYSQGRPILLSLLVDYLSFPGEGDVPEMLRQNSMDIVGEDNLHRFEEILFERLRQDDLGETLVALGRVPKGADEELLAALLDIPVSDARRRLREVQSLSVVKIRPEDQRLFLHDELYSLLQRHVYSSPYDGNNQKVAFEAIKEYYSVQRDLISRRLNELYAPVEEHGKESLDLKALTDTHTQYQALLTEVMYYFLQHNLGRGFRAYYRYSHEAIMSHDISMELQLQAELFSFLSRSIAEIVDEDISVDMILAFMKIRPLARTFGLGDYNQGLKQAHTLIETVEKTWRKTFPSLLAAAHVWTAGLHIMSGTKEDVSEADMHFKEVELLIPYKMVDRPFEDPVVIDTKLWLEKAIWAFAYRTKGYQQRMAGFMKKAVDEYQLSAMLLREIDLRIEMGITKNDMGFAQAELGEWHDGRSNVLHALRLRRELGSRIPVALSLNTLATIDVREGQYSAARENAERALSIFRAFSYKRGIGMALTTLSESMRRLAGTTPLISDEERIKLLREARDYAREAIILFGETGENSRRVEALIEAGCASRDWAWYLQQSPRPGDDSRRVHMESNSLLTDAAKLAKQIDLMYRYVDALGNLIWLKFYVLKPGESDKDVLDALDEAERAFPSDAEMDKQPQVWAQKGKLYILKGHLAYRQFEQKRKKEEPKGISTELKNILEDIAKFYAFSLEFSSRFTKDYQGIRRSKDGMFERLQFLNAAEMRIICNYIQSLYPNGSVIQNFLTNRAQWQTG
jgi:uncharacterized protein (DUF2164 family)